jgi:transcriptional regulator with XRE-family HTH domain
MPRPNGRDPEADPAAYLGKQLRQARIAAGYASQDALAAALGFERSTITKAESGARAPTEEVFARWCEACGVSAEVREVLAGLNVVARNVDGPVPTWFKDRLDIEGQAHTILQWQPLLIPGLLQTADYARAVFQAEVADNEKVAELVAVRLARQAIFDRTDPPHIVFVLDELVVRHRLIGSSAIMSAQLFHLAEMSERPNVSIHVLPSENGANAGLFGAFSRIFVEGDPDLLHMDAVEDQLTGDRALIRKADVVFDLVRRDALPRTPSRTVILEAAETWKSR